MKFNIQHESGITHTDTGFILYPMQYYLSVMFEEKLIVHISFIIRMLFKNSNATFNTCTKRQRYYQIEHHIVRDQENQGIYLNEMPFDKCPNSFQEIS